MESETKTTRYSDADLNLFKERILEKLQIAKEELSILTSSLSSAALNGGESSFKTLEDGAATLEKESINQLAARQKKFVIELEEALGRIENKTYGFCKVTGKLIQKERLLAVPHTTLSMEAKMKQSSGHL